jgi:branched-chain amino acid transport system permease protein
MLILVTVSTVQAGSVYALVGLAYYLVVQVSGTMNFATGGYTVFAALTMAYLAQVKSLPVALSIALGVLAAVVLAALSELLVVKPIETRPGGDRTVIIALVALLFALSQFAGWIYGQQPLSLASVLGGHDYQVGGTTIPLSAIIAVVVALASFALASLFVHRTPVGRMVQAVGEGAFVAATIGVPVGRMRVLAFAVSGLVTGLAGAVVALGSGASFDSGLSYSLYGFVVLVLGGLGSAWGALVGAYVISLLQALVGFYLDAQYESYLLFGFAALLLTLRPQGIFTTRTRAT